MRTGLSYRIVNSKTEYFVEHSHDYYEIFIMLTGEARHMVSGKSHSLRVGDAVLIRPSDTHKYKEIDEREFTFLNLTFTEETLRSAFEYLGEGFPARHLLEAPMPPVTQLTRRELARVESQLKLLGAISPDDVRGLRTALRIMLMEILCRGFSDYTPHMERVPGWLEELCIRMRTEGGFVDGAAKMVEMSGRTREHLSRSMKRYMGITVTEFVNELRLNYIANMLRNSNRKIAEIVFESGFNTMSLATELFRRRYGMGMREFRNQG